MLKKIGLFIVDYFVIPMCILFGGMVLMICILASIVSKFIDENDEEKIDKWGKIIAWISSAFAGLITWRYMKFIYDKDEND